VSASAGVFVTRRTSLRLEIDWYAVTAGGDMTIALTRHVALVPQVRVHAYPYSEHTSLVFVRPRVALRWRF
jgi:hypothetical protein